MFNDKPKKNISFTITQAKTFHISTFNVIKFFSLNNN